MKIWILLFLIMAAIYDYRDFKIPNKLNGAGALITLVFAGVSGMKAADMMIGVLVVLIGCGLLFYIGCLGGGDVKLAAACGLVLGLPGALIGTILGLLLQLLFHLGALCVLPLFRRQVWTTYPMAPFLAIGYAAAYYI